MFEIVNAPEICPQNTSAPVSSGAPVSVQIESALQDNPWIKWAALGIGALILINLFKKNRK